MVRNEKFTNQILQKWTSLSVQSQLGFVSYDVLNLRLLQQFHLIICTSLNFNTDFSLFCFIAGDDLQIIYFCIISLYEAKCCMIRFFFVINFSCD